MFVATGITKQYGGVTALADAGIELSPGEVHALLGENGAGKSTLVKVLAGVVRPDAGTITRDGAPLRFAGPRQARAAGVAIVSQELNLFGDLDVLGNLFPYQQPTRGGLLDRGAMTRRALPVLAELGVAEVPLDRPLARLTLAQQQLVEISRALLADPAVLILDEPTSALPAAATDRLADVVRRITARGVAVLYVSHFLEEAMSLADRVTVLRDGRNVLSGVPTVDVGMDRLVTAMLGDSPLARVAGPAGTAVPSVPVASGGRELRLSRVSVRGALDDLSLAAQAGEVVGLAGLQGAGHTAVLDLVWGLVAPSAGTVRLPGGGGRPTSMSKAVQRRVAYVPSDRKRLGLMLEASVRENVTSVAWLARREGGVVLRPGRMAAVARRLVSELRIRGDVDSPVAALSGGNQQKVVFAKWLYADPEVVLLDDPTRGVDVGAKAEMHAIIRRLAAAGAVVLMCSTDLAELADVCDRVVVLRRGQVLTELTGDALTEHDLLRAINAALVTG